MTKETKASGFRIRNSVNVEFGIRIAGCAVVGRALPAAVCMLTLLLTTASAHASDAPPTLDALLQRIEFNGAERPETLGKDLAELNREELTQLCEMLVEPGTGDDTRPRMALHALTLYCGKTAPAMQRDQYVDVLCAALDSEESVEIKKFLIRQLHLIGSEKAVDTLLRNFFDIKLHGAATQALLAIGTDKAVDALAKTAGYADKHAGMLLLTAICQNRDKERLQCLALESDLFGFTEKEQVCLAEMAALVAAEDIESAAQYLHKAMQEDSWPDSRREGTWWANSRLTTYALEIGRTLAEEKQTELAIQVYHDLIEHYNDPEQVHVRCAALSGLADAVGAEAIGDVVRALTDKNPELRAAAVEIAVNLAGDGVTPALIEELETATTEVKIALFNILGRRGDQAALPAVLKAFTDANTDTRIVAMKAAAAIGGEQAIEPLVALLGSGEPEEFMVIEDLLTTIQGESVEAQLVKALETDAAPARCALLRVLTRRRATAQLDKILAFTSDKDESVKIAAIEAVGKLANDVATTRHLIGLISALKSDESREALADALVAIGKHSPHLDQQTNILVNAIDREQTSDYCFILGVLGNLGGVEALGTTRKAAADQRAEVKEAAIRAFSNWPDSSPADDILDIAKKTVELKHHVLAMRGYARLVAMDQQHDVAQKLHMFAQGLEAARRPDEKKLIISKIAEVHDPLTLEMLNEHLNNDALRNEIAAAMLTVADKLPAGQWKLADATAASLIETVEAEHIREKATALRERLSKYEGYILTWQVSGPYFVKGKTGPQIFDSPFPPELAGNEEEEWKPQVASDDPDRFWHADLSRSVGGDNRAAYLRAYVWSDVAQDIQLELGSDDGIKVWLNHEVIHANNIPRGCAPAQDKVNTRLKQGWNELMLKITNGGGGWGACARIRSADGGALKEMKITADTPPDLPAADK